MASVVRAEPTRTALFRPQLLNVIEEREAYLYAASPNWIGQEKHDGTRHSIFFAGGKLSATNKLGTEISLERKVAPAFEGITLPFRVDGELVGETFYAFDLLEVNGQDLRKRPYVERHLHLSRWLPQHPNVVLVECVQADTTFIDRMKAKGAEGVVFKRPMAPYSAGRPNSGGDHFKFKFQNTASFICLGQNGSKRSVKLGLLDEHGICRDLGSCTIPANHKIPENGTIVEVRYLYAYRGGSVFQPCYLGERNDILPDECLTSQLKFKGEGTED